MSFCHCWMCDKWLNKDKLADGCSMGLWSTRMLKTTGDTKPLISIRDGMGQLYSGWGQVQKTRKSLGSDRYGACVTHSLSCIVGIKSHWEQRLEVHTLQQSWYNIDQNMTRNPEYREGFVSIKNVGKIMKNRFDLFYNNCFCLSSSLGVVYSYDQSGTNWSLFTYLTLMR